MNTNQEVFLWIVQNQKKTHEEYIQRITRQSLPSDGNLDHS